ncbi:MAG: hypothetical protein AUF64_00340 [Chloroflexi bacterium 13_1_20CM_54_36]|nr:MAG: hypothetical protein AUF64_00340 [Chloroflexi bacterium 13_1_20CM_54_36]
MSTSETTTNPIAAMSDTEVLVATAKAQAEIYGQVPEYWETAAALYGNKTISEYEADIKIEETFGDEYCLDPELCREWLITEAEYGRVHTA